MAKKKVKKEKVIVKKRRKYRRRAKLDMTPVVVSVEKFDKDVHHPKHYTQGAIECIDALEAATVDLKGAEAVGTASAIKYLWRWKQKGGKKDLQKARWYLDRLIASLDKKAS